TILITYPILTQLIRLLPLVHEVQAAAYTEPNPFAKDRGLIPAFIILVSLPVVVALQWFEQSSQIANLEKAKSATELNLLKQQINPHFFFNTLNNLYALSIVKDRQTPEVIMQLSELMRYVIYKGKENFVTLKEEIKYIEDYVQLQQIRLHKNLDFRFDKTIDDPDLAIPPLLFITFVENAFKHGIEPAENDCYLHLSLEVTHQILVFTCENSVEEKNTALAGIGQENLRRRMALRFPNAHEIKIEERNKSYKATLKIIHNGL
ncbi:MAG: sensor histidine kinase, partial [Bacteroidota bacterium]